MIRYKTRQESADENERLIRDVFAELAEQQPPGLHYAAFRLDDGVSFLHIAVIDGATNPLSASAAFGKFQAGIQDRCVEGPAAADAAIAGSYQFMPGWPEPVATGGHTSRRGEDRISTYPSATQ